MHLVIQNVKNVVQYNVEERFQKRTEEVTAVVSEKKLPLFSSPIEQKSDKTQTKVAALKDDRAQLSRFYINCHSREGNLQEFFQDENHPWPPYLVQADRMREGQRSDVANCLEKVSAATGDYTEVHLAILDGAVIIQMTSCTWGS